MDERIGIFGGTFDPVHNGHVVVARSFLHSGYIDELWIIPSPDPPHKKKKNLTAFEKRERMLAAAFSGFENVEISDVEEGLAHPSFTIRTIKYLKQQYPDKIFYLCIGEDSLSEFESWHKPDLILEECELLVASRPGFDRKDVKDEILRKAHFVEHDPVRVSSTELRRRLSEGKDVENEIPASVLQIIRNEGLYRK